MGKKSEFDLVVVGAGVFGLTVARLAADDGKRVLVVERRPHIGGNCYDYVDSATGINIHKYGSHLFHTSNKDVWDFLNRFTEFSPYEHRVFANSGGQVYSFPMNLSLIAQVYGRYVSPEEAKALITKEASEFSPYEAQNLEEKAISLIGRTLYEKFIKGYTAKQWQTDPKDLDPSIITRLPVRYTFDNRYFSDTFQGQPKNGFTAMFDKMADHKNIEILYNVDYLVGREQFSGIPTVYTGPLDAFFEYRFGRLPWRTVDFVNKVVNVDDFQGTSVMNFNDESVPYTRVVEHQHYDPLSKVRKISGKTVISEEFSRYADESDEVYYPVLTDASRQCAKLYKDEAKKLEEEGIWMGGRLGGFLYYDMDQAVNSAMKLYRGRVGKRLMLDDESSPDSQ